MREQHSDSNAERTNQLKTHQTRDFYLAAYLIAKGIKLLSHTRVNGSTFFNFVEDGTTAEAINGYYSMGAQVEPITYATCIKSLKSVIHSYDHADSNSKGPLYEKQLRNRM